MAASAPVEEGRDTITKDDEGGDQWAVERGPMDGAHFVGDEAEHQRRHRLDERSRELVNADDVAVVAWSDGVLHHGDRRRLERARDEDAKGDGRHRYPEVALV